MFEDNGESYHSQEPIWNKKWVRMIIFRLSPVKKDIF